MLQPISIGTNTMPGMLYSRLSDKLETVQKKGFLLDMDVDKIGEFTFMGYRFNNNSRKNEKEVFELIKNSIANCLADIIVDEWEIRLVKKIVRENYFYYNEEEKKVILEKTKEILNPAGLDYTRQQRKEKVLEKILAYLDLHEELILEGFINFRLKDYHNELEDIVNAAVDEFMLEREYNEFIRLLKYFVDIQEPRVEKIQIVFKDSGKFNLYDAENQPFRHECLEGLMFDLLENEINYDDLLLSALITLAPRTLELHLEEGFVTTETVKMINNVFGKRVSLCEGCVLCRPKKKE